MPASLKRHLCCSKAGDSSYGAGSAGISCQTDYVRNGQHIDRRVERFGNIRKIRYLQQKKKGEMMLEQFTEKYICCL